jgi:hypothetical protein
MVAMMHKFLKKIIFIIFFLGSFAHAAFLDSPISRRDFEKIIIPDTKCGDGSPYQVFYSKLKSKKLAFDFMGGGACWSFFTCIGPTPMAWVHHIPFLLESGGFVSSDPKRSPVSDYSLLFFPYCSGDVYLGDHTALYGPENSMPMLHQGKRNIEKTLKYLVEKKIISFAEIEDIVVYGYSAGAIGAIYHLNTITPYLTKKTTNKVLIADSPGLHFGNSFWNKFTPNLLNDFKNALSLAGIALNQTTGNLGQHVKKACDMFPDWKVGILQASKDIMMSQVFGSISPSQMR